MSFGLAQALLSAPSMQPWQLTRRPSINRRAYFAIGLQTVRDLKPRGQSIPDVHLLPYFGPDQVNAHRLDSAHHCQSG